MTQQGLLEAVRVVRNYNIDTLGAPFRVILKNGVTISPNSVTGEDMVDIPDPMGLIGAVVRARVSHPRKLSGAEIKFVRKALGLSAKGVAGFLDITPEHFSRCEAGGGNSLQPLAEKMFRIFAHLATHYESPEELIAHARKAKGSTGAKLKGAEEKDVDKTVGDFIASFIGMKLVSVFEPDDELCFELVRRPRHMKLDKPEVEDCVDKVWSDKPEPALVAA